MHSKHADREVGPEVVLCLCDQAIMNLDRRKCLTTYILAETLAGVGNLKDWLSLHELGVLTD